MISMLLLTQNPLTFFFSIYYTASEINKKKLKNTKKMGLQKTLYLAKYHLFFQSNACHSLIFHAKKKSQKCL